MDGRDPNRSLRLHRIRGDLNRSILRSDLREGEEVCNLFADGLPGGGSLEIVNVSTITNSIESESQFLLSR